MKKAKILYTETDEISGYYQGDSVLYKGTLIVKDKKTKPVSLELAITMHSYGFEFPETKIFTGDSVTDVYAKLSKWFSTYGFIFQY